MILVVAFLLLVSLVVSTAIAGVGDPLESFLPSGLSEPVLHAINLVLSLGVITLLFAALFKVLPRCEDLLAQRLGRRRGLARGFAALGLLLGADPPLRGRVHRDLGLNQRHPSAPPVVSNQATRPDPLEPVTGMCRMVALW